MRWQRRAFRHRAPRERMEGKRGLWPCPHCGRMNGILQRTADDHCAPGVGCQRDRFRFTGGGA